MSARLESLLTPAQRAACAMHDADYGRPTSHSLDPRNDADEAPATLEDILDDVEDEQMRTPELLAFTISKLATSTADALPVDGIADMAAQSFDTLLAIVGGGANQQVLPAVHELRQRIRAFNADVALDEARSRHEQMQPTLKLAYDAAQDGRFWRDDAEGGAA